MKQSFSRLFGVGVSMSIAVLAACSSSSTGGGPSDAGNHDTAPAKCEDSQCFPGNKCLADQSGTIACRLPCTQQSDCPWDYTCTEISGSSNVCTQDTAASPVTGLPYKQGKGTWGDPCDATGGVDNNPDCDYSQGFRCYAKSPTDGNAYCTQIFCKSDADCRGGYWCATVNYSPNALSYSRSTGQTYTVCQPRVFCASCQSDVDCASPTGIPEHCIAGRDGSYCAPECTSDSNCNNEAQCITLNQSALCSSGETCICAHRARTCNGDGKLCSPCRSDADCKAGGGLCLQADYSTEHFCGVPSTKKCSYDQATGTLTAGCPTTDEAPNKNVISCLTGYDGIFDPPDQCVGLTTFGQSGGQPIYVLGCWTPER